MNEFYLDNSYIAFLDTAQTGQEYVYFGFSMKQQNLNLLPGETKQVNLNLLPATPQQQNLNLLPAPDGASGY